MGLTTELNKAPYKAIERRFHSIVERTVERAVKALTDPLHTQNPLDVSNIISLRSRLKPADLVLVCGTARISRVVKVLTISKWSHVVMYVGDRRELLSIEEQKEWTDKYGQESLEHLVIDADPIRKVHLKPIDDLTGLMLRHCRAEALSENDSEKVITEAISQLGKRYDVKHILRLLVFFAFPWELLPEVARKWVRDFTLSEDDRICSRVIAEAFHSVGYPIRPLKIVTYKATSKNSIAKLARGLRQRRKSATQLLLRGKISPALKRLTRSKSIEIHLGGPRHITPSDYDLSRFFSIIKDEEDLNIDYSQAKIFCPLPE